MKFVINTIFSFLGMILLLSGSNNDLNSLRNGKQKTFRMDTINYLSDCFDMEVGQGSIQGSENKSTYILGSCFQGNESYELVLVPRREEPNLLQTYRKHRGEVEKYFKCYTFLLPMAINPNPENEFDTYKHIFPCTVTAKKCTDGKWEVVRASLVSTFEELGEFKSEVVSNY